MSNTKKVTAKEKKAKAAEISKQTDGGTTPIEDVKIEDVTGPIKPDLDKDPPLDEKLQEEQIHPDSPETATVPNIPIVDENLAEEIQKENKKSKKNKKHGNYRYGDGKLKSAGEVEDVAASRNQEMVNPEFLVGRKSEFPR